MTFFLLNRLRREDRGDSSAGVIVFLMMALVFVPIIAVHVALAAPDQLQQVAAQQLAAIVNAILAF